ncbi:hypothetical protein C1H76_4881 [Elsinoe australis]|uniref:NAD dependent epimerase/dehydratase n=1 Tax=Elsinoe australis TaxID=40998 RepID=A0A4U7B5W4_9PEZI|nr:hypothetical protein C1H76_4881 [Elsinoe australis]
MNTQEQSTPNPSTPFFRRLKSLYPINEFSFHRNPSQPPLVIALGLSRTGTESLSKALTTLGYGPVSHGLEVAASPSLSAAWGAFDYCFDSGLRADTFNAVIGDRLALTDNPTALFAEEMIAAYPHAKFIVNMRSNQQAWHRSWKRALVPFATDWELWFLSLFNHRMFWMMAGWNYLTARPYNTSKWDTCGREVYKRHYQWIETSLQKHDRRANTLYWEVHDGWGPLCNFLGHAVPDQPFPNGNAPKELKRMVDSNLADATQMAQRNIIQLLIFSNLLGLASAVYFWYVSRVDL